MICIVWIVCSCCAGTSTYVSGVSLWLSVPRVAGLCIVWAWCLSFYLPVGSSALAPYTSRTCLCWQSKQSTRSVRLTLHQSGPFTVKLVELSVSSFESESAPWIKHVASSNLRICKRYGNLCFRLQSHFGLQTTKIYKSSKCRGKILEDQDMSTRKQIRGGHEIWTSSSDMRPLI